jgi:hypothetical protein
MGESLPDRRLAQNQAIFRDFNERMQKNIKVGKNGNGKDDSFTDNSAKIPIDFFCECSDDKCQKQIRISPDTYNKIHEDKLQFIVLPDHQIERIEDIVERQPGYLVIRKHIEPPGPTGPLNRMS